MFSSDPEIFLPTEMYVYLLNTHLIPVVVENSTNSNNYINLDGKQWTWADSKVNNCERVRVHLNDNISTSDLNTNITAFSKTSIF